MKVYLPSSRKSQVLQYTSQWLAEGFADGGHVAKHDYPTSKYNMMLTIKGFKPDLIVLMNQVRYNYDDILIQWSDIMPLEMPVISYITDHIDWFMDSDNAKNQTDNDIIIGAWPEMRDKLNDAGWKTNLLPQFSANVYLERGA